MRGIGLKLLSVGLFLVSASLFKASEGVPSGQMVFFRAFFAIPPIMIFFAWQGNLVAGMKTAHPLWHFGRGLVNVSGMVCGFYALMTLPLPEAVSIGYVMPLLTVVFGAIFLKETVRAYRWTAVLIGFVGVAIIMWPRLTVFSGGLANLDTAALGALGALAGAVFGAVASLIIRTMVKTERPATIVFYASITSSVLALLTFPFGWVMPTGPQLALMIAGGVIGGIGQVVLTESFRQANVSLIAPFEYASLIFSIAIGYLIFGEVPTTAMMIGSVVVVAAGVFVIFRERQLGLERDKSRGLNIRIPG